MIRTQVRKLSNPHRKVKARRQKNSKTATRRRHMTAKQIRIFGTARQKAALRRSLAAKRSKAAPAARRPRRSTNPTLLVTLGSAVNPHRRKKAVPHTTKNKRKNRAASVRRRAPRAAHNRRRRVVARHNPVRSAVRRRRRNSTRVVVMAPRHHMNRRRHHARRSNPSLFGNSITSKQGLQIVGGAMAGLVAAKFIPTLLPTSMLGSLGSSNVGKTIVTGASAVLAGFVAGKWNKGFGDAVLLGGLVQTASVALNAFLPSVYSQLGLSLGDLLPGQFSVPQNPIRAGIPAPVPMPSNVPAQARVTMNGLNRAYGNAF